MFYPGLTKKGSGSEQKIFSFFSTFIQLYEHSCINYGLSKEHASFGNVYASSPQWPKLYQTGFFQRQLALSNTSVLCIFFHGS